jgi:hypothetical protein
MNFRQAFWGTVGTLAVALPLAVDLAGAGILVPSLSSTVVTALYVVAAVACAVSFLSAFYFAVSEQIEAPIFSLMGAGTLGFALMTSDMRKDGPGLWGTLFVMGVLLLLWRGLKWFFHTSLFEVVLQPGVNFVPNADNMSAEQKFKAAERIYNKLAIEAGYGRTGMDYYTRGRNEHRYGADGMPVGDLEGFVEAVRYARMTRAKYLVLLVRNMPGKQNEPAVLIITVDDAAQATVQGDALHVSDYVIPAKDIAAEVFFGWTGEMG